MRWSRAPGPALAVAVACAALVAGTFAASAPAAPAPAGFRPLRTPTVARSVLARIPTLARTPTLARMPTGGNTPAQGAANEALSPSSLSAPGADPAANGASEGDPLAQNGFGSVLCRDRRLQQGLSDAARSNCATSSFVAAAAPTGNYAFDVHIDTGLLPAPSMIVQDLLLTPVWTALVWVTHALLVALEWCYSLDLLGGSTMAGITAGLRTAQATVTQPWLAAVLSVASVLAMYHGLIRRRVAETLGEVLLMGAMMVAGLWVMLNPLGTVGNLGHWANSASLGALGAVESGNPGQAASSLADGMRNIFTTAVGGPWCFLEFGNVDWCRDAGRLDPRLRTAGIQIARAERATSTPASLNSAALLGAAQNNGDLFLALPANGPQRNSINDTGSLLRVMCQSADATNCRGPTAAQAQFRTGGATWSRAGGLLLIVVGSVGMICVLSFIALRLLGAAVASLFYLLMAPVAVLAPALGDGGREAFRAWGRRLLGALAAKLIYSVLLGVVLLMLHLLQGLRGLGWWTQWLLVACLWWTAFAHRHQVLGMVSGSRADGHPRSARPAALTHGRELARIAARIREGRAAERHPPKSGSRNSGGAATPSDSRAGGSDKAQGSAADASSPNIDSSEYSSDGIKSPGHSADVLPGSAAGRDVGANEQIDRETAAEVSRRERAPQQGSSAQGVVTHPGPGDDAHEAGRRASRERQSTADLQADAASSQTAVGSSDVNAPAEATERSERHHHQAPLLGAGERVPEGEGRDYASLAGLAGLTSAAYRQAGAGEQVRARMAIDRELDRRRQVLSDQRTPPASAATSESSAATPQSGRTARSPERATGDEGTGTGTPAVESTVMRRERQLLRESAGSTVERSRHPRRPTSRDGDD